MTDNNASIDRYFNLVVLKGQLEEIHHSIEQDLISKVILDKKEKLEVDPGATKTVTVKLKVTNRKGRTDQTLVIEELTRLKTLVDSMQSTITYMQEMAIVNNLPQEANHGR